MITNLRGRALDWYMKLSMVLKRIPEKILDQIQVGLIDEFKNIKYESECITEIKEIKKLPMESIWEFDQRFKTLMVK